MCPADGNLPWKRALCMQYLYAVKSRMRAYVGACTGMHVHACCVSICFWVSEFPCFCEPMRAHVHTTQRVDRLLATPSLNQ